MPADLPRITRLDDLADLIAANDCLYLRERRHCAEPWVLRGEEVGRGPDNEPLVTCREAIAWVDQQAVDEANRLIDAQQGEWGPLDRGRENAQNA